MAIGPKQLWEQEVAGRQMSAGVLGSRGTERAEGEGLGCSGLIGQWLGGPAFLTAHQGWRETL